MYDEDDESEAVLSNTDSEDEIMDASLMTLRGDKVSEALSETSSEDESDKPSKFQSMVR